MIFSRKQLKHLRRDAKNALLFGWHAPRAAERIFIAPSAVVTYAQRSPSRSDTGRVLSGNWDLQVKPLDDHPKVRYCINRFVRGQSWEEAGAIEHAKKLLDKRGSADGRRSWAEISRRLEEIDKLYSELKETRRLKTSAEFLNQASSREDNGVYIHIDRFGRPIFGGKGCHRFAICKILDIPVIPAQLGLVHEQAASSKKALRKLRHDTRE